MPPDARKFKGRDQRQPAVIRTLMLAGRPWRTCTPETAEQMLYLVARVELAFQHLAEITKAGPIEKPIDRLVAWAVESGTGIGILGGKLLPIDAPRGSWNMEMAHQTEEILRGIQSPLEQRTMEVLIGGVMRDLVAELRGLRP